MDGKPIYATGHSNEGAFTYLLWAARGEVFTAMAPSAAAASYANRLSPKPAMQFAAEHDPLVKFTWQTATMAAVCRRNNCEAKGRPWNQRCVLYSSKTGTSFVACIYPGRHEFNQNAPELIVNFF